MANPPALSHLTPVRVLTPEYLSLSPDTTLQTVFAGSQVLVLPPVRDPGSTWTTPEGKIRFNLVDPQTKFEVHGRLIHFFFKHPLTPLR